MDRLDAMRAFRRVVERGSFRKAATDLCLSPAGLSKQVRALEAHLGTVLIHRTTRRMGLTDTGQAYFDACCRMLDELDELERGLSADSADVSGRLRINAPLSFGLIVLSPLLARFLADHPKLHVDLTLTDQVLDVISAGFDITIRVRSELPDSSLISRRLAGADQVMCTSPAYAAVHGVPLTLDELHQHACLTYSLAESPGNWRLTGPDGATAISVPTRLTANNGLLLRDMLLAGLGIGDLPDFVARPYLDSGALLHVLPQYQYAKRHVFAVYPTSRHLMRKVRVLVDYLAEALTSPKA